MTSDNTRFESPTVNDEGREVLSWEEFGFAARELATNIVQDGYEFDVVVAIARGGLIPAGAISYALGTKNCGSINVEFYSDIEETLAAPVVLPPFLDTGSLAGKRVLLVDDVADSGRTLDLVVKLLRSHCEEVRSVTIYSKPGTIIQPNYVWRKTDRWIDFPWSDKGTVVHNKPAA
ncbi:phosphoribosyltransferase [Lysinibacter sp. HNR]|uniref:phosphoribosyltransferase n=1 Tax=Lysinibacter sp. HNR TaxID=3031408 RepID=UPI0024360548|nr:phosphoribosyltransferase [Lysinibacter sp. HNR]WGD36585.1 phosphoribosyltransferase [Lysinibacter sp. HNR]